MTRAKVTNSLGWEVQMFLGEWESALEDAKCKFPDGDGESCYSCDCEFFPTRYETRKEAYAVMKQLYSGDRSHLSEVRIYEVVG